MIGFSILGHQLLAWTLGLAVASIFLDLGAGFVRDHPPLARRLLGGLVGPLACLSLLLLSTGVPLAHVVLFGAPFAGMGCVYSWAWVRRWLASRRRAWGRAAGVSGAAGLLLLMLTSALNGSGGLVIAAYVASVGLLGGFTALLVAFVSRTGSDEVEVPPNPYGLLARVVAVGLSITLIAAVDAGPKLPHHSTGAVCATCLWLGLSLGLPALLTAAGHKLFPRFQPVIWGTALLSALIGQAALHTLILMYPPAA